MSIDTVKPESIGRFVAVTSGAADPYASLRTGATKYQNYWPMNEGNALDDAADSAGLYNLAATGGVGCQPVAGGGRETLVASSRFLGTGAYDLASTWTVMGWYNRRLAGGLTIPFGNRNPGGQVIMINGGAAWLVQVNNPTQTDTGVNATGTSFEDWKFFCLRHNAATKSFELRIDDAHPGGTNTGSYTGTLAAASAFGVGGDDVTTFTTTWHRAIGLWPRLVTAGEETLLFAAGSQFIL